MNKRIKSSFLEKAMYGIGDIGANLCWTFVGSFITLYYTDSVGLAGVTVANMMLVARFLDGISDIVGGFLIEKIRFKSGKIRPWFWISAPLLGIGVYASFNVPMGLSGTPQIAYVFLTYTYTAAIAFTLYTLAFVGILPLMSLDANDRNATSVSQRIVAKFGMMLIMGVSPVLISQFGGEKSAASWHKISIIYAILCTVLVFLMGVIIKEKSMPEGLEDWKTVPEGIEKRSAKEVMEYAKIVISDKYVRLLALLFIGTYLIEGLLGGGRAYFCRDVLGDFSLQSYVSYAYILPMVICLPFVPVLVKKVGKKKMFSISCLGVGISTLLQAVFPHNATLYILFTGIASALNAPLQGTIFTMVADVTDYIKIKKGIEVEGFVSMTTSVGIKIGTGFGTAIVGWGLSIGHYNQMLEKQPATAITAMIVFTVVIPGIASLGMFLVMLFWDLEKRVKELQKKAVVSGE